MLLLFPGTDLCRFSQELHLSADPSSCTAGVIVTNYARALSVTGPPVSTGESRSDLPQVWVCRTCVKIRSRNITCVYSITCALAFLALVLIDWLRCSPFYSLFQLRGLVPDINFPSKLSVGQYYPGKSRMCRVWGQKTPSLGSCLQPWRHAPALVKFRESRCLESAE